MVIVLILRVLATASLIIRTGQHVARGEPDPVGLPQGLVDFGNWSMLAIVLGFVWEPYIRRLLSRWVRPAVERTRRN